MNNGRNIGLSLQHEYEEKEHKRFMEAQAAMERAGPPSLGEDESGEEWPLSESDVTFVLIVMGLALCIGVGLAVALYFGWGRV